MKISCHLLCAILLFSFSANAAIASNRDRIGMGGLNYGGTGCPQGSVAMAQSADGLALTLLFSGFVLEVGGATQKINENKSCTVNVAVDIPQGFKVSIAQFDYRGFHNLPQNARSELVVHYGFLQHGNARQNRHEFVGPLTQNYLVSDVIERSGRHRSNCSARRAIFRISPNIRLRTNAQKESALATLDSLDSQTRGLKYNFEMEAC